MRGEAGDDECGGRRAAASRKDDATTRLDDEDDHRERERRRDRPICTHTHTHVFLPTRPAAAPAFRALQVVHIPSRHRRPAYLPRAAASHGAPGGQVPEGAACRCRPSRRARTIQFQTTRLVGLGDRRDRRAAVAGGPREHPRADDEAGEVHRCQNVGEGGGDRGGVGRTGTPGTPGTPPRLLSALARPGAPSRRRRRCPRRRRRRRRRRRSTWTAHRRRGCRGARHLLVHRVVVLAPPLLVLAVRAARHAPGGARLLARPALALTRARGAGGARR